jgi:hypothetical protein
MSFESDPYGKDGYEMRIIFFADSETRGNLLELTMEYRDIHRGGKYLPDEPRKMFDVRISPLVGVQKILYNPTFGH